MLASALSTEPTALTFNIQPLECPRGIITETDRRWFDKNPSDISLDIHTLPWAPPNHWRPSSFTQVEATQDHLQPPTTPQTPLLASLTCTWSRYLTQSQKLRFNARTLDFVNNHSSLIQSTLSFGNYTVTVVTHLQLPNKPIRNNSIITLWNTYIANDKFLCFEEKS
jgi:hypothetical protein